MDDSVYKKEEFLEIYRSKQNMGTLKDPTVTVEEVNPYCGDKISLQLKVEDGKVQDAAFTGDVCGVARVSSSLLTEALKGRTVEEAASISDQDLKNMMGFELTASREKCATLCLDALKQALSRIGSN